MMERYKGYWITGSAVPGPPYTHYWHPFGKILKDGRLGSVVEVVRFQDTGIRFDHDLRRVGRVLRDGTWSNVR